MTRFACVLVPFFAAAAVERGEPTLRERPLALVAGAPPATRVVEANARARERGVEPGMADAEAGARCPALVRRPLAEEAVTSARHALLDAALGVSPRVEDAGPGIVHVDIAGLTRLIGDPATVAGRLARQARRVGLPARVAVAPTRTAARLTAMALASTGADGAEGAPTIVEPGGERAALARIPLHVLELPGDLPATLAGWGIATLGDLAALPRDGVAVRLGVDGIHAHDLACGRDRGPFRVYTPSPYWEEAQHLDWEIDALPALARVAEAVLGRLCARLEAAHLRADALEVRLRLATGDRHERTVVLASPMDEVKPMLALVRLDLEAHPARGPVVGVAISVHTVPRRAGQRGLWQPPAPALRDLASVLARLATLVGTENVGSAVLVDSHRPDAFTLTPFSPAEAPAVPAGEAAGALTLRRLRPPRRVHVETAADRPAWVTFTGRDVVAAAAAPGGRRLRVATGAGPWRSSGEWWDTQAWGRDEWDVALSDGTVWRVVRDHASGRWFLEGAYD